MAAVHRLWPAKQMVRTISRESRMAGFILLLSWQDSGRGQVFGLQHFGKIGIIRPPFERDFGERRHVPALQKRLLLQNCSPTIRAATEVRCPGPSLACKRLLGLTFETSTHRSSGASLRLGKVAQQTAREPAPSGKAKTNEGPGLREGSRQQQLPLESEDTTSAQVCSKNRITFR
jgi:hypothetical protein